MDQVSIEEHRTMQQQLLELRQQVGVLNATVGALLAHMGASERCLVEAHQASRTPPRVLPGTEAIANGIENGLANARRMRPA